MWCAETTWILDYYPLSVALPKDIQKNDTTTSKDLGEKLMKYPTYHLEMLFVTLKFFSMVRQAADSCSFRCSEHKRRAPTIANIFFARMLYFPQIEDKQNIGTQHSWASFLMFVPGIKLMEYVTLHFYQVFEDYIITKVRFDASNVVTDRS